MPERQPPGKGKRTELVLSPVLGIGQRKLPGGDIQIDLEQELPKRSSVWGDLPIGVCKHGLRDVMGAGVGRREKGRPPVHKF